MAREVEPCNRIFGLRFQNRFGSIKYVSVTVHSLKSRESFDFIYQGLLIPKLNRELRLFLQYSDDAAPLLFVMVLINIKSKIGKVQPCTSPHQNSEAAESCCYLSARQEMLILYLYVYSSFGSNIGREKCPRGSSSFFFLNLIFFNFSCNFCTLNTIELWLDKHFRF